MIVFHLAAWPVDIGQSKHHRADTVNLVVDADHLLGGEIGDFIDAPRIGRRILANRQPDRPAVLSARARIDQSHGRIVFFARFQKDRRAADINVDVRKGIGETQDMVRLAGQMKDIVFPPDELIHGGGVADVAVIHGHFVFDRLDVKRIAALVCIKVVDNRYLGTQFYQRDRKRTAYKSQSAGDQDCFTVKSTSHGAHIVQEVSLENTTRFSYNGLVMKRADHWYIAALLVALAVALLNSAAFFLALLGAPPGTVAMGVVHYPEDYFFYLNHFFQGAHGAWLTVNRYTSELTNPSIIYWSNVLMGKIGGLVGLPAHISYNLWILILSFTTLGVTFFLMRRLFFKESAYAFVALLVATFSTSLINRIIVDARVVWYPFQLWRTPHFAFDRLGGAPHQILQTILFLLVVLAVFAPVNGTTNYRRLLWLGLAAAALTTVNPVQSMILWAAIVASVALFSIWKRTKPPRELLLNLIALTATVGLSFWYTSGILDTLPHVQSRAWEATQQVTTTPWFLLRSIGPIVVLFALGLRPFLRSVTALRLFSVILPVGTYALFLSPIPALMGISNVRVIFPALYLFLAVVGAEGLLWLATASAKACRQKPFVGIIAATLLYGLLNLPTIVWEIGQKIPKPSSYGPSYEFLPLDLYQGFQVLQTIGSFQDVVLASPANRMDLLVPALSGHTSVGGHMLATIRSPQKRSAALAFFTGNMTLPEAKNWLTETNVRYVFLTRYDGNAQTLQATYPFLKTLTKTETYTIFSL